MMKSTTFYKISLLLGRISGCHQRPDRSFFFHGRQFPVCARCTGVFIGECISVICFRFISLPTIFLLLCCAIMFADWFFQYLGVKESTNSRRFITGLFGGYAYFTLILSVLLALKHFFLS